MPKLESPVHEYMIKKLVNSVSLEVRALWVLDHAGWGSVISEPLTLSLLAEMYLFCSLSLSRLADMTLCSEAATFASSRLLLRSAACLVSCGKDHIQILLVCVKIFSLFHLEGEKMLIKILACQWATTFFLFLLPVQEAGRESDQTDLGAEEKIMRHKDQGPNLQCRFPTRGLVTQPEGHPQSALNTLKSYSRSSQWLDCHRSLSGQSVNQT